MRLPAGSSMTLNFFQLNVFSAYIFKESKTITKEDWHNIHAKFIGQACFQALLCRARRADDGDILIPCGFFCLQYGTFQTVCHKSER